MHMPILWLHDQHRGLSNILCFTQLTLKGDRKICMYVRMYIRMYTRCTCYNYVGNTYVHIRMMFFSKAVNQIAIATPLNYCIRCAY